jgi:hypothetical protein
MQRCPNCALELGEPGQTPLMYFKAMKHPELPVAGFLLPGTDLHLNKELPPVDCPLLIKVPAGTRFPYFESGHIWELEHPVLLLVHREHWERSKDATPTYSDEFGNKITGKFEWTYP